MYVATEEQVICILSLALQITCVGEFTSLNYVAAPLLLRSDINQECIYILLIRLGQLSECVCGCI